MTKKIIILLGITSFVAIIFLKNSFPYEKEKNQSPQNNQWSMDEIKIDSIHQNYKLFGKGVSIAILDTGIDSSHKDLNIKYSYSLVEKTVGDDDNGHGTNMAGIINAQINSIGITGIAPLADIYSIKVLDKMKSGSYSTVIEGIEWAIANEIDIILMSLGSTSSDLGLENKIKEAHDSGIVIVSAVGNYGYEGEGEHVAYPAKYSSVISVGATTKENSRWFNSSQGSEIDVMAPGEDILTTALQNKYSYVDGTSVAAAFVTGGIALLLESDPLLSPDELKLLLKRTANPLGNEQEYGSGLINLEAAIKSITSKK
ncbi:S8 family peptidase [Exiguobacterium sp. s131]|uniref:S8 family peptidase n=1 Tax=Exiguobacterium sp. s131 TaxID=2751278 RepID=UPI001BE772F1|nr:S8 family peptidase [Exiguobacterium sp. s131]